MAVDVPENVAVQLMTHSLQNAQESANGNRHIAEALRTKGMQDLDNVSLTEGLGIRYVQGPHPQYGSPDGRPTGS